MSISIESIKEALAECPICSDIFNEDVRIPRRMPCCLQPICQPCLETYRRGQPDITCPLCRENQHLQDGVESLPKEMLILRFLNHLRTQSNRVPLCTDCPHRNPGMAKCSTCSTFLCQECLHGHAKNGSTHSHSITTFEQAREKQLVWRSISRQNSSDVLNSFRRLQGRSDELALRIDDLQNMNRNLFQSRVAAVDQINKTFDDIVEILQERRGILLALVESKVEKEAHCISRAVESHKELQLKLKKATETGLPASCLASLVEELPQDVEYDRRGVCFLPSHVSHVKAIIRSTGIIRTVTFTPTERPEALDKSSHCNAVSLEPADVSHKNGANVLLMSADEGFFKEYKTSSTWDQVLVIKDDKYVKPIMCPYMEYDHSTASNDVITTYGQVIRNAIPECSISDTGCRLQAQRTVLLTPPMFLDNGRRSMFHVKVDFRLKETLPDYKMIFELATTHTPVDFGMTQNKNLTVWIGTNPTQEMYQNHVNLIVKYNRSNLFCRNISDNKAGESRDLHLCFMFDESRREIHVIDVQKASLLTSVPDVMFDRPVWMLMYLGRPEWTDISGEILSGNRVEVSQDMCELLSTL